MTKPPIPTENSKTKGQHTQTPPKTSITQRLRTDLGRSVGVTSNPTKVKLKIIIHKTVLSICNCLCNLHVVSNVGFSSVCPQPRSLLSCIRQTRPVSILTKVQIVNPILKRTETSWDWNFRFKFYNAQSSELKMRKDRVTIITRQSPY